MKKHMKKSKPIFKKLFVIFSSFALIPVVFIGVISFYVSYRFLYQNLQNTIWNSANQVSLMTDRKLEEIKHISESFTANSEIKRLLQLPMTDENILLLYDELNKTGSVTSEKGYFVTLCGINGQIYLNWNTDGMIYRNPLVNRIKGMSWFDKLEESRNKLVWIPYTDNIADYDYQGKVVSLARNIMNNTMVGEDILGFVVISIPSVKISSLMSGVSERVFIIDENYIVAMSQNEKEIGNELQGLSLKHKGIQRIEMDGVVYIGCVKENQIGGLYTVVLVPSDSLRQQVLISVAIIFLSIALLIGVIFMVAYYVSQSLASPILALEGSMQRVESGKLEKSIIETDIVEIRSLADNYNVMVDQIGLLIEEKVVEEQRRKEIEIEKTHAELKFLRAQIMPHFLFNTLNSIKWLAVIHGATPVEGMITALGRLLECSMQKGNDFIPLKEELENVKAYLKIQEMHYGNRIRTDYQIEEEIAGVVVPKLVLQPLVENAIIHGIDKNPIGGRISIRIFVEGEKLIMEVEDDGPGIPKDIAVFKEEEQIGKGSRLCGIGIQNVNRRIQLIYGGGYGLFYRNVEEAKGTIAVLVLKKEEQHVESTTGR